MVRPHAYLNGGVTHPVQQAQWPFFNTACSLPLFTGTPNANANAGGQILLECVTQNRAF